MEDRCTACEVYGGKEQPCMGPGERAAFEQENERPCPRVVLHADNAEAWTLFAWLLNENVGRLLQTRCGDLLLEELFTGVDDEDVLAITKRSMSALQDGRVSRALYPDPKAKGAN